MELICKVQTYPWGKWGNFSTVAKFAAMNNPEFRVDESECYAEFWMGTHPNAPSVIRGTGQNLGEWIRSNPDCLGNARTKFGDDLSFLFKVLSVNKPLSIQAHPNRDLAKKLHARDPNTYKDPNHKPELAIALTNFEALVGFRPYYEIREFFQTIPEFRVLAKEDNVLRFLKSKDDDPDLLKECFSAIMNQSEDNIKDMVNILICRLKYSDHETQEAQLYRLVKRLDSDFPGDVGIFGCYLFNHVELKPGQAIFLGANVPHAYLAGDCVECMACSDNVVRAGLTPKKKDVLTLVSMLEYNPMLQNQIILSGLPMDSSSVSFSPPIPDFNVLSISVNEGKSYDLCERGSASIILIASGTGTSEQVKNPLVPGSVIFLPAHKNFSVSATTNMKVFQAASNETLLINP